MNKETRVLILEDYAPDSELMISELETAGINCTSRRVDTRKSFAGELETFSPHLILSDFRLPHFDGLSALVLVKEKCPDVPFILVSGAIGEEMAIEIFKRGATDYVLKDHLSRLGPAVRRALLEAEERNGRKRAEEALQAAYKELERRVQDRTAQLAEANEELKREIVQRKKAEAALEKARDSLEAEVEERTALWIEANKALLVEIAERKEAEKKILASREQLRLLNAELIRIEENERQHIAAALHDRLGQSLAIAKMKVESLKEVGSLDDLGPCMKQIREMIDRAIKDTRSLMAELSPPTLHQFGLSAALESLIEEIEEQHSIFIEYESPELQPMDGEIQSFIYRSVREILMNTIKHAEATTVKILLNDDEQMIRVDVRDDGIGFDTSKIVAHPNSRGGYGLYSIRERLTHFGGNLSIQSATGEGTHSTIIVPRTLKGRRKRS